MVAIFEICRVKIGYNKLFTIFRVNPIIRKTLRLTLKSIELLTNDIVLNLRLKP